MRLILLLSFLSGLAKVITLSFGFASPNELALGCDCSAAQNEIGNGALGRPRAQTMFCRLIGQMPLESGWLLFELRSHEKRGRGMVDSRQSTVDERRQLESSEEDNLNKCVH